MNDLLEADIVLTTIQFLKDSRAYASVVEDGVHLAFGVDRKHARSMTAISAFARRADGVQPIIEAVHWRRVIVDEMHEMFRHARNLRALGCISSDARWGLTATPDTYTMDAAQQHYWLLLREKAHHPNMLHHLVRRCIRLTRRKGDTLYDDRRMRLVALPCADELQTIQQLRDTSTSVDIASIVQICTQPHRATDAIKVCMPDALIAREALEADDAAMPLDAGSSSAETSQADRRRRLDFVRERVDSLAHGQEVCAICQVRHCDVMLRCAHIFCRICIEAWQAKNSVCPVCRCQVEADEALGVALGGTKLSHIADVCARLDEPVIVFSQWKTVLRSMRAIFRGRNIRTYALDGNSSQRQKALREFATGGVLLLSLDDSFAGLHLPHVRWIFFSHAIVADRQAVRALEYQAVARCVRWGQTRDVSVYSFVAADCEEEALWRSTHDEIAGGDQADGAC